ncbi:MAG: hypothetical protein CVV39_07170 [Planctomycetes bacterium HGW-Planctomycetes-1]|nr:MAG: hypothetical protein CVV39_07170 [Planctomycetes bacterium HGW-Planctomycetes-1]
MLPQILALTVDASDGGAKVDMGNWPFILGALPLVIVIVLIVMLTWYFLNKKRLEHQQILAAIEKGTPLSELRPVKQKGPNWIGNLTVGITFFLMGLGWFILVLLDFGNTSEAEGGSGLSYAAMAFLAIGIAFIVKGILQRSAEKAMSAEKSALDANQGQ